MNPGQPNDRKTDPTSGNADDHTSVVQSQQYNCKFAILNQIMYDFSKLMFPSYTNITTQQVYQNFMKSYY